MDPESEQPTYLQGLSQKLASATDAVLVVKGKEFPVHKVVLALNSKFFDDLFQDCCATTAPEGGPSHIVLVPEDALNDAVTPESFELLLTHLYTKQIKARPPLATEAELLLPVADFFGVADCLQQCSKVLSDPPRLQSAFNLADKINSAELLRVVNLAQRYKLRDLMARCMPYVVEDSFNTVNSTALAVPFDAEVMKAVVVGITQTMSPNFGYTSSSFRVGSGYKAVSADFYLQYLAGWGH